MPAVRINGFLTFDPSDFDTVAGCCEELVAAAQQDTGVLEYSYWANDAHDTVLIREHYEDEDSLLSHLGNMDQDTVGRLVAVATLGTVEVAAPRTPRVEEALGGFGVGVKFFEPLCALEVA